jgi:hypothetical protein
MQQPQYPQSVPAPPAYDQSSGYKGQPPPAQPQYGYGYQPQPGAVLYSQQPNTVIVAAAPQGILYGGAIVVPGQGVPPNFVIPNPCCVIVLGIIATVICFWICGIPAIILGCMAQKYELSGGGWGDWMQARYYSRCGLNLGIQGIVWAIVCIITVAIVVPILVISNSKSSGSSSSSSSSSHHHSG